MTSQINFAAINENFPIAGQDNDTQVFRDNFDTTKNNFRFAQEEITDLQDNVLRSDQENDLNGNKIFNAVLLNNRELILDGGGPRTSNIEIDFETASYQIYRVGANLNLVFQGLPGDTTDPMGVGKLTVELYGDGSPRTVTLDPSGGVNYRRINWPSNAPTPTSFIVQSNTNPVIIELWRYSDTTVFVNYLGNFLPSGGSGTISVAGLSDIGNVDVSNAVNGQVLKFNSSTQQWTAQNDASSSIVGLTSIPDVTITAPNNQDTIRYNSSTDEWVNQPRNGSEYTGSEELSATNLVASTSVSVSYFSIVAGQQLALTLPSNGVAEGQIKTIICLGGGTGDDSATVQTANPGWKSAGSGLVGFTGGINGNAATLQFINGRWYCIGNNGAIFT